MNSVFKDAQLLAELDAEIKKQEASMNNPAASAVIGAFLPGAKKLLPIAQQETARKVELMNRVMARLKELMDEVHK